MEKTGILAKAQKAKQKTEEATLMEELKLKNAESILNKYTDDDLASWIDKLNVVGINKYTIYQDKTVYDVVILKDGKFYNVVVIIENDNSINYENVKQVDGVREEAVILYKILENDFVDIEFIDEESLKYNGTIYMGIEYQTSEYEEIYIENEQEVLAKRAIKIKVNTGDDGVVVLPIAESSNCTIEWGDGTTTANKTKEYKENIKVATINNSIKLALVWNPDGIEHEYAEKGVDKTVTITGDANHLDTDCNGVTKDKIIEIEQWGETGLGYVCLDGCNNLTKIATPSRKSFVKVESFIRLFTDCTSLQSVPEGFFDSCSEVYNINSAFYGCTSLTTAPTIPSSVTNMNRAFYGCTKLTGDLVINATNPIEYTNCLTDASTETGTDLKLSGSCPKLENILATKSETSNISLK